MAALLAEPTDLALLLAGGNNAIAAFAGVFVPDGDLLFATADAAGDGDGVCFLDGCVREEGRLACSAIAGVVVLGAVLAGMVVAGAGMVVAGARMVVAGMVIAGGWATLEGSSATRPCTPKASRSSVCN